MAGFYRERLEGEDTMLHIAIMGFGTVGAGVAEVVRMNAASIAEKTGEEVNVKYILDVRDFPDSPYKDCFVKDFADIESDPEVDIVVETIGGATIALDFTTRALKAGKSVVTSNKELVATHGYELLQLLCRFKADEAVVIIVRKYQLFVHKSSGQ